MRSMFLVLIGFNGGFALSGALAGFFNMGSLAGLALALLGLWLYRTPPQTEAA